MRHLCTSPNKNVFGNTTSLTPTTIAICAMASFDTLPTELLLDIVLCLNSPMALFNLALVNKSLNSMFMPVFLFSQEAIRVGIDGDPPQGAGSWQHVALIFPLTTWGTNMPVAMRSRTRGRTRVANALSGLQLYFDLEHIDHLECRFSPTTSNHTPAASLFKPYLQGLALAIRRLKRIRRIDIYFDSESRIQRELASFPSVLDSLGDDMRDILLALAGKGCEEFNIFDRSLYILGCERLTWWSYLESAIPQSPLRGRKPAQDLGSSRWGTSRKDSTKMWKGLIERPRKQLGGVLSLVKAPTGKGKGKKASLQHDPSPIQTSPQSMFAGVLFPSAIDSLSARTSPERPLPPLPAEATNSLSLRTWNFCSPILLRQFIRDDLQLTLASSAHTLTKLVLSHLSGPPLRSMTKEHDNPLNFLLNHFPQDNVLEELVVEWCSGITVPAFVGFLAKCQKLQTLSFDRTIPFLDLYLDKQASKQHPIIDLPSLHTLQAPTDWFLFFLHVPHKWHLREGDYPVYGFTCTHNRVPRSPIGAPLELGTEDATTPVSPLPLLQKLTLLTRTSESIFFTYQGCAPVIDAVLAAVEHHCKGANQPLAISVDAIFSTTACLDCDVEALASLFDTYAPTSTPGSSVKPHKPGLGSFKNLKGNVSTRLQNLRRTGPNFNIAPTLPTSSKASSTAGIDFGWVEVEDFAAPTVSNPSPLWRHITRLILPNRAPSPMKSRGGEWWRTEQEDERVAFARSELRSLAGWVVSLFPGVVDVEMMCPASVETKVGLAADAILDHRRLGYDYWDWNVTKRQRRSSSRSRGRRSRSSSRSRRSRSSSRSRSRRRSRSSRSRSFWAQQPVIIQPPPWPTPLIPLPPFPTQVVVASHSERSASRSRSRRSRSRRSSCRRVSRHRLPSVRPASSSSSSSWSPSSPQMPEYPAPGVAVLHAEPSGTARSYSTRSSRSRHSRPSLRRRSSSRGLRLTPARSRSASRSRSPRPGSFSRSSRVTRIPESCWGASPERSLRSARSCSVRSRASSLGFRPPCKCTFTCDIYRLTNSRI